MKFFGHSKATETPQRTSQAAPPPEAPGPALATVVPLVQIPAPEVQLTRRLLFVEGDQAVPQRFSELLRERSRVWDVAAAPSANEAMALLEQRAFDGVVASARLPGGSGVDLLNELSRRFPNLVRLIRYAPEDKALLRGFVGWPPCHLTRDMDAREIELGLQGAFQLAEWMADPALKTLIPKMIRLPAMPELYEQVMKLLADPNSSTEDVGRLIAQDPALTAKMLQMVNAAAFGMAHPVTSAVEAVLVLGAERTKALILVANTALHFDLSVCEGFSQEQFWHHSLATAGQARSIVQLETKDNRLADQAFTAGVLHDIGKLLFAANLPQEYSRMLATAKHQKKSDEEAERLAFGASHAQLGACLLGTWGLPLEFLRAIAWHHAPSESGEVRFSILTAVHVANAFDHGKSGSSEGSSVLKLDHRYLSRLGLNDRWNHWRELGNGEAFAA